LLAERLVRVRSKLKFGLSFITRTCVEKRSRWL
jgi:hypothetical protein